MGGGTSAMRRKVRPKQRHAPARRSGTSKGWIRGSKAWKNFSPSRESPRQGRPPAAARLPAAGAVASSIACRRRECENSSRRKPGRADAAVGADQFHKLRAGGGGAAQNRVARWMENCSSGPAANEGGLLFQIEWWSGGPSGIRSHTFGIFAARLQLELPGQSERRLAEDPVSNKRTSSATAGNWSTTPSSAARWSGSKATMSRRSSSSMWRRGRNTPCAATSIIRRIPLFLSRPLLKGSRDEQRDSNSGDAS